MEENASAGGVSDGKPMSIFALMVQLERQGVLDLKLSCHKVQRPPAVVRGEDEDRSDAIKHMTSFWYILGNNNMLVHLVSSNHPSNIGWPTLPGWSSFMRRFPFSSQILSK